MKHLLILFLSLLSLSCFAQTPCGGIYEKDLDSVWVFFENPETEKLVSLEEYKKKYKPYIKKRIAAARRRGECGLNEHNYDCEKKGIKLYGKVYVTKSSNADFEVRITDRTNADYIIKKTDCQYPRRSCGYWCFVDSESQADFTVCFVTSILADFTIFIEEE